jgi:hypothetical protein
MFPDRYGKNPESPGNFSGRSGKKIYFILRWENTRGKKGLWSEIVSAVIP